MKNTEEILYEINRLKKECDDLYNKSKEIGIFDVDSLRTIVNEHSIITAKMEALSWVLSK